MNKLQEIITGGMFGVPTIAATLLAALILCSYSPLNVGHAFFGMWIYFPIALLFLISLLGLVWMIAVAIEKKRNKK